MPEPTIVADVDPDTNRTPGLNSMREKLDTLMGEVRVAQGAPKQTSTVPEPKPPATAPVTPAIQSPDQKHADASPTVQEDDVPASIKSTKAADDFRAIKKVRDEYKTKAEQLEVRAKELETKLASAPKIDTTELETLRKQKAEAEEFVKKFAIEHDPRFQEQYNTRIEAGINRIKSVVGGAEGEKLAQLVKLPDSQYRTEQIESVLADLSPFKQTRFSVAVDDLEKAMAEKESIVKQARDNFSQLERTNLEQINARKEAENKQRAQVFDSVIEKLKDPKDGLPLFQYKPDDEAWNGQVNERIGTIKAIVNREYSEEDLVRWAGWAVTAPSLLQSYKEQAAEIQKLTGENKALQAAQPTIEQGQAGRQGQQQDGDRTGSFMKRFNQEYQPKG